MLKLGLHEVLMQPHFFTGVRVARKYIFAPQVPNITLFFLSVVCIDDDSIDVSLFRFYLNSNLSVDGLEKLGFLVAHI